MAIANMDVSEFLRKIQLLNVYSSKADFEDSEELNFYKSLLTCFTESLETKAYQTLIPICLHDCSLERAKNFASSLGLSIVEGRSGQLYVGFSEGLKY